jgi:GNAT superfamily N-acetyltransferase
MGENALNDIRIELYDDCQQSPALLLVAAYKDEIKRSGLGQGGDEVVVNLNSYTVAAMNGERCVGFILYAPYPAVNAMWIGDAYVDPDYRRKGIHGLMFNRVVEQARLNGFDSVQGATSVQNVASIASMEKQGRELFGVMYRYDVNKAGRNG